MSGPYFGWVDVLHSLSLGMMLCRQADRLVFEKSNFDVDRSIVSDLVAKGLVIETAQGAFEPGFTRWIGPAGPKTRETLAKLPIPSFTRRVRQNSAT
jgi:hypothetical protein